MSKSGNRHVRWRTTELAWSWLRYQPESALSVWFRERYGSGGKRLRRIGMVAVARKLRIALWRVLKTGVLPEGAILTEAEVVLKRCVTPEPGVWWRRPVVLPGLPRKPSERWGRLLQAFQLSSKDAWRIG